MLLILVPSIKSTVLPEHIIAGPKHVGEWDRLICPKLNLFILLCWVLHWL